VKARATFPGRGWAAQWNGRPLYACMDFGVILLFLGGLVGGFSRRGHWIVHQANAPVPAIDTPLIVATCIAELSLYVWGFMKLGWYWPILLFIVTCIFEGKLKRSSPGFLVFSRHLTGGACLAVTWYAWFKYVPFKV